MERKDLLTAALLLSVLTITPAVATDYSSCYDAPAYTPGMNTVGNTINGVAGAGAGVYGVSVYGGVVYLGNNGVLTNTPITIGSAGSIVDFINNTVNSTSTALNYSWDPAHPNQAAGAAIYNDNRNTTIYGNFTGNAASVNNSAGYSDSTQAGAFGGAAANGYGAGLTVGEGSSFTGNGAGNGGAIFNSENAALTVNGGTAFTNNAASISGGAIYNDNNGTVNLNTSSGKDITFSGNQDSNGNNDIYNDSTVNVNGSGVVTLDGGLSGTGTTNINNTSTLKFTEVDSLASTQNVNITSNAKMEIANSSGTFTLPAASSQVTGTGTISKTGAGTLNISGATGSSGLKFAQSDGTTNVSNTYNWASTITGGTFNLNSGANIGSTVFNINGGTVNNAVTLNLGSNQFRSTGSSGTLVNTGTININGDNSDYKGTYTQDDAGAVMNVNNRFFGGASTISRGALNWNTTAEKAGSAALDVGAAAILDVKSGANLILNNAADSVIFNSGDTWTGAVQVKYGTLTLDSFSANGQLVQSGGNLNLDNSTLTLLSGSGVASNAIADIDGSSKVVINGGELNINLEDSDVWAGEIDLQDGVFNFDGQGSHGILNTSGGTLNIGILNDPTLTVSSGQTIASVVNLGSGSTIDIDSGGDVTFNPGSKWSGTVENAGAFTLDGASNAAGGKLSQTSSGADFNLENNAYFRYRDGVDSITNGDVNIKSGSNFNVVDDVTFGSSVDFYIDNGALGSLSGALNTVNANNLVIEDGSTAGFAIDIKPRPLLVKPTGYAFAGHGYADADKFNFNDISTNGGSAATIQVDNFKLIGLAPMDRTLPVQLFDTSAGAGAIQDNITFKATKHWEFSPIGWYGLLNHDPYTGAPTERGWYNLHLMRYNPQVFRGQVATQAMYNNQLSVNNLLFDRVNIPGQRHISQNSDNRYAANLSKFDLQAQQMKFTEERGGLWAKTYSNIERLAMTGGLNINNTMYGTLAGADLPVIKLKNGWKMLPTAYIGYNGGRQSYSGVTAFQNGGQAGVMGTFMKKDLTGSLTAYGGGYNNEMQITGIGSYAGATDQTGNWFAGTAAKVAYNLHPTKRFTIQPNALVSYNIFGGQRWHSDYGVLSMNTSTLNGINAAPGLNLIFNHETWSAYFTSMYVYNINDHIGGRAGNVDLPRVSMRHGFFEYGFGATKAFKDRLAAYLQINIRNVGRTGVGFQAGLSWKF